MWEFREFLFAASDLIYAAYIKKEWAKSVIWYLCMCVCADRCVCIHVLLYGVALLHFFSMDPSHVNLNLAAARIHIFSLTNLHSRHPRTGLE